MKIIIIINKHVIHITKFLKKKIEENENANKNA